MINIKSIRKAEKFQAEGLNLEVPVWHSIYLQNPLVVFSVAEF